MEDRLNPGEESDSVGARLVPGLWLLATLFWWGLAFAPPPGGRVPDWLKSTRSVCFGTLENGLPDTWGWMILIFGPLSFGIGLWVGWGEAFRKALKEDIRRPIGWVILLISLTAMIWEGVWVAQSFEAARKVRPEAFLADAAGDLPDSYPMTADPAPDFQLMDQFGQDVTLRDFRGKPLLLTFAFANCRTICPAILQQSRVALEAMPGEASLVVITLDPWRDTPAALQRMAATLNIPEGARILSGTVSNVVQTLKAYNMPWSRDENTGDVQHPALTYILDAEGRIAFTFSNVKPDWLVTAVRRLPAARVENR